MSKHAPADPTPVRLGLLNEGYMPTPICQPGCNHVDRHGKSCKSGGKAVHISAWAKGAFTAGDVQSWHRSRPQDTNTGILCGEMVGVDMDILDPVLAAQVDVLAEHHLGPTPLRRIGRAPKLLRCYRAETPIPKLETPERRLNGETIQVEIMGKGQQVAAYGTHPATMQPYTWVDREPLSTPLIELPVVGEGQLRNFLAAADVLFAAAGAELAVPPKAAAGGPHVNGHAASGTGGDFFRNVNQAALANIRPWFTAIFPIATQEPGTGAWRASSADLGRPLEEDLSMHPTEGGQDFGTREPLSPITLAIRWAGAPDAKAAAAWLCEQLGKNPADLGWKASTKTTDYAAREERGPQSSNDDTTLVLSPGAPLVSARAFIRLHHIEAGLRTLHHQNDTFYTWRQTHYAEAPKEDVRGRLYGFLDKARRPAGEGSTAPFDPTRAKVANVLEATAAEAQITYDIRPPTWLGTEPHPPAPDLIACTNGLLHITTRELLRHTPAFFSVNALPFAYQSTASEPREWLSFLAQIWPEDQAAIDTLQEMFGLLLTGDTRHQKAFLIVGPKRSGKGTIARVLMKLLGQDNVCGPTLSSLSTNFGLAPLIGKRLAVISDARLGSRADQSIIVERILSITGEDTLTVDRKNRDAWTGRFEVRFVVLTNELPRLTDSSGALASRFIILALTQSFLGKEDHGLTDRLVLEMPGILNWSLAGLTRLRERGYFVPPASSGAAQQELEDLGSPIGAFLRDRCDVGGDEWHKIAIDHLFDAWCAWCRHNNHDRPGTAQMFGRDLRAALPNLEIVRPRNADGSEGRTRCYKGITMKHDIG